MPASVNVVLIDGALRLYLTSATRGEDARALVRDAMQRAKVSRMDRRLAEVAMRVLASGGLGEASGFCLALSPLPGASREVHVDVRRGVVWELVGSVPAERVAADSLGS